MAVIIGEVTVEVIDTPAPSTDAHSPAQQVPAAKAEQQVLKLLALVQQRQDRLRVD